MAEQSRTEYAPQLSDPVRLLSGGIGHVRRVIAWWPKARLWDVVVADFKHDNGYLGPNTGQELERSAQVASNRSGTWDEKKAPST